MFNKKLTPLCGIDEAGRGPLAGPLVIAGVVLVAPVAGLDDSKKLSPKKREQLYELIVRSSVYHIAIFDAEYIDMHGISVALNEGLCEIMEHIQGCRYLFDGNSTFGVDGLETLIGADGLIDEVGAASIVAKVTRDRYMCDIAKDYPQYGFEKHKGYGTKAHIEAIARYGKSPIHRKSFFIRSLEE